MALYATIAPRYEGETSPGSDNAEAVAWRSGETAGDMPHWRQRQCAFLELLSPVVASGSAPAGSGEGGLIRIGQYSSPFLKIFFP